MSNEKRISQTVDIDVSSRDGSAHVKLRDVIVVDEIPISSHSPSQLVRFDHLRGLQFASCETHVDLLIGQNHAELLIPLETRTGRKGDPFPFRTLLGWTVNGPVQVNGPVSKKVISHFVSNSSLEKKVQLLWSVENEGLIK